MLKSGTCVSFADPALSALEADIFWCLGENYKGISAYIHGGAGQHSSASFFSLGEVSCRKTLLKTYSSGQYLMLNDNTRVSQILCKGVDIRCAPVSFELVIDGFLNINYQLKEIKQFINLCQGKPSINKKRNNNMGRSEDNWTVEARRNRDAMVALDKRMANWSYRKIAVFIYGKQAVSEDWNDPNRTMKNRVIRSAKRGFRLRGGTYKKHIH